jgi:hypothetical protein
MPAICKSLMFSTIVQIARIVSAIDKIFLYKKSDFLLCTDDYYLCVECESLAVSNHKYASKHKATHNMLVFRISRPRILHLQARSYYARNILSALSFVTAPPGGLLAAGDDTSETRSESSDGPALDTETSAVNWDVYTCAECDVKQKSIFYLCIACQGQIFFYPSGEA